MFRLDQNPDFKNQGELYKPSNYLDINGDDLSQQVVIHGTDAIDQAIEAVIVTEPWERLFNIDFWSPFYKLLFSTANNVDSIVSETFDMIEKWTGVIIERSKANVVVDSDNHEVALSIPYLYVDNGTTYSHTFSRAISK